MSSQTTGDTVGLTLRMRFIAELNAAARRVIDPAKVTWLQDEQYDLVKLDATVLFKPRELRRSILELGRLHLRGRPRLIPPPRSAPSVETSVCG